jgi:hypothetical protein
MLLVRRGRQVLATSKRWMRASGARIRRIVLAAICAVIAGCGGTQQPISSHSDWRSDGWRSRTDGDSRNFYTEGYHQLYLAKNPGGYCGLEGKGIPCPIGGSVVVPVH